MEREQAITDSFFADADVISSYSRTQAIEDGFLVDLSNNEVIKQNFKFPVTATAAVWQIIDRAIKNRRYLNDLNGIISDICWMSKVNGRKLSESARLFQVIVRGAGRKSTYAMKIVCGPGDSLEPVLTIMMADED